MNWKQAFSLGLCSVGAYAPQDEQWEVLFEGTVKTIEPLTGFSSAGIVFDSGAFLFSVWDRIRITVDGVSAVYTASESTIPLLGSVYYAGNYYLSDSKNFVDDGYNFLVRSYADFDGIYNSYFKSRTPGTYTVKIERKVAKMYSYNGVRLPKLPEWDKTVYPYAVIYGYGTDGKYKLLITDQPLKLCDWGDEGALFSAQDYSATNKVKFNSQDAYAIVGDAEWGAFGSVVYSNYALGLKKYVTDEPNVVWTNADILDEINGGVYLAATEPIPVYA